MQKYSISDVPASSRRIVDVGVLETLFNLAIDVTLFVKDLKGRYHVVSIPLVERHGLNGKAQVSGRCPRYKFQ